MSKQSAAAAVTPELRFAPSIDARRQTDIQEFLAAYTRGEKPQGRMVSAYPTRIVGETPTGPVIRFVIFTERVARDGDEFMVGGADLEHFRRNPRMQWAHDYQRLPVGNWVRIEKVQDTRLGAIIEGDAAPLRTDDGSDAAEFSKTCFRMLALHDLDSCSGGWMSRRVEPRLDADGMAVGLRHLESDVLEASLVPIGADPHAMQRAIQAGRVPEKFLPYFVQKRDGSSVYTIRDTYTPEAETAVPKDEEIAARPYDVVKDHAECPASKPYAVVKEGGDVMGCHESEEKAQKQQAALYAAERAAPQTLADVTVDDVLRTVGAVPAHETPPTAKDVREMIRAELGTAIADLVKPDALRIGKKVATRNRERLMTARDAAAQCMAAIEAVMAEADPMADEPPQDDERTAAPVADAPRTAAAHPTALRLNALEAQLERLQRRTAAQERLDHELAKYTARVPPVGHREKRRLATR
jgi:hypothetical protein